MNEKLEILLGVAAQYVLHDLRFGWKVPLPEKGDYIAGSWHSEPALACRLMLLLLLIASLAALPVPAKAQSLPDSGDSQSTVASTTPAQPDLPYTRGAEGYGKRIGSDFGIAAVSTTTRYALSEAFKQDG